MLKSFLEKYFPSKAVEQVEEVAVKTVDTVIQSFTSVLADLEDVAAEGEAVANWSLEQVEEVKRSAEASIKSFTEMAERNLSEAERAKTIIAKLTEIFK